MNDKGAKNILITGGAGFIGANLALELFSKGDNITVLDTLSPQIHGSNPDLDSQLYNSIKNKVRFVKGSVCDRTLLKDLIVDNQYIYHLAAETGTGQSMYEISRYYEINVQGTANLLDVLGNNKNNVKKILVSSSRSIYGEGKYVGSSGCEVFPDSRLDKDMLIGRFNPIDIISGNDLSLVATNENSKIHPVSVYGMTKQFQEEMIMKISPTIGIIPVALRYQNVYGPGQSLSNPYTGILAVFSTRILNGNPIEIFEDGLESRDFVYIDDVVNANILAMESQDADNQVFNVGYGKAISVLSIAEKLLKLYNKDVEIKISGRYRVGDIRHNYADISKIKSILNFVPKVDFDSGLLKFANWVKTQNIHKDNFENSILELKNKGLFKG